MIGRVLESNGRQVYTSTRTRLADCPRSVTSNAELSRHGHVDWVWRENVRLLLLLVTECLAVAVDVRPGKLANAGGGGHLINLRWVHRCTARRRVTIS